MSDGFDVDEIYKHFTIALLWATQNSDYEEERFLDEDYEIKDIAPEDAISIKGRIRRFLDKNQVLLLKHGIRDEMIGHDLFLTSQGHGVGFWDRGYGKDGDTLTEVCKRYFSENSPEVGVDRMIHYEVE